MHLVERPNFYLFTGGPGAGKTTVLQEIKQQGYSVIPEVARHTIPQQRTTGKNAY